MVVFENPPPLAGLPNTDRCEMAVESYSWSYEATDPWQDKGHSRENRHRRGGLHLSLRPGRWSPFLMFACFKMLPIGRVELLDCGLKVPGGEIRFVLERAWIASYNHFGAQDDRPGVAITIHCNLFTMHCAQRSEAPSTVPPALGPAETASNPTRDLPMVSEAPASPRLGTIIFESLPPTMGLPVAGRCEIPVMNYYWGIEIQVTDPWMDTSRWPQDWKQKQLPIGRLNLSLPSGWWSPLLMLACFTNHPIARVEVCVPRQRDSEKEIRVVVERAWISSYSTSGSGTDNRSAESIEIKGNRCAMQYAQSSVANCGRVTSNEGSSHGS